MATERSPSFQANKIQSEITEKSRSVFSILYISGFGLAAGSLGGMKRVAGGGKVPIRESGCRIIEVQTLSFRRISVLFCNREDGIHWLPLVLFSFLCWLKEVVCSNWSKALIRKAKKFGPRGNGQLIGERIYPCMDLTLIILLFILSTYCFFIFFPFFFCCRCLGIYLEKRFERQKESPDWISA